MDLTNGLDDFLKFLNIAVLGKKLITSDEKGDVHKRANETQGPEEKIASVTNSTSEVHAFVFVLDDQFLKGFAVALLLIGIVILIQRSGLPRTV